MTTKQNRFIPELHMFWILVLVLASIGTGTDSFTYTASNGLQHLTVLFEDNFDRPDNSDVDASSVGMSGQVAPLDYFERETASVVLGKLSLDGWSRLGVCPSN